MVTKLFRISFLSLFFVALIGGSFSQAFAMGGRHFTKSKTFRRASPRRAGTFFRDLVTGVVKKSILDEKNDTHSAHSPQHAHSKSLPFNARRNSRAALVGAIAHIAAKGSRVSSNLGLNSPKNSAPAVKQEIEKNTEPASTTVDQKLSQEKLHNLNLLDKILLAFYVKVSSLLKTMKSVGSLQFNNL